MLIPSSFVVFEQRQRQAQPAQQQMQEMQMQAQAAQQQMQQMQAQQQVQGVNLSQLTQQFLANQARMLENHAAMMKTENQLCVSTVYLFYM